MTMKIKVTEDWASLIIGLVLILITAATAFFPEMPKFGPKSVFPISLNSIKDVRSMLS